MSDEARVKEGARFLLEERRARQHFVPIPTSWAPRTIDEAYDTQEALTSLLAPAHGAPAGYKIALTTAATQQMVGFAEPIAGILFGRTIHESPTIVPSGEHVHLGIECEIAVQLRAALPASKAPYSRDGVADAVGSVMAAFELIDDRQADYRQLAPQVLSLVADNVWNAGVVLGRPQADWRMLDLAAARGAVSINGQMVGEGYGRDVLGHPLASLTWLVNMLATRGKSLVQGAIVITGSIVTPKFVHAGDQVEAVVDGLGDVQLSVV